VEAVAAGGLTGQSSPLLSSCICKLEVHKKAKRKIGKQKEAEKKELK